MRREPILIFVDYEGLPKNTHGHVIEFCKNMAEAWFAIDLVICNATIEATVEGFLREICEHVYVHFGTKQLGLAMWVFKTGAILSLNSYVSLYTIGLSNRTLLFSLFILRKDKWIHHHFATDNNRDPNLWSHNYIKLLKTANHLVTCSVNDAKKMNDFLNREVQTISSFSKISSDARCQTKFKRLKTHSEPNQSKAELKYVTDQWEDLLA
jgi:hypothetical protein